jgi:hypothetical protein
MAPTKEYALICLENPLLGTSWKQLAEAVCKSGISNITLSSLSSLSFF